MNSNSLPVQHVGCRVMRARRNRYRGWRLGMLPQTHRRSLGLQYILRWPRRDRMRWCLLGEHPAAVSKTARQASPSPLNISAHQYTPHWPHRPTLPLNLALPVPHTERLLLDSPHSLHLFSLALLSWKSSRPHNPPLVHSVPARIVHRLH